MSSLKTFVFKEWGKENLTEIAAIGAKWDSFFCQALAFLGALIGEGAMQIP